MADSRPIWLLGPVPIRFCLSLNPLHLAHSLKHSRCLRNTDYRDECMNKQMEKDSLLLDNRIKVMVEEEKIIGAYSKSFRSK